MKNTVEESNRQKPLGRPRLRWEYCVKRDVKRTQNGLLGFNKI